jgi:hypothetical protein
MRMGWKTIKAKRRVTVIAPLDNEAEEAVFSSMFLNYFHAGVTINFSRRGEGLTRGWIDLRAVYRAPGILSLTVDSNEAQIYQGRMRCAFYPS